MISRWRKLSHGDRERLITSVILAAWLAAFVGVVSVSGHVGPSP